MAGLMEYAVGIAGMAMVCLMLAMLAVLGVGGLRYGKAGWWPLIYIAILVGIIIKIMGRLVVTI